ncbi:MAG: hypothetical protein SWH54_00230 [Thermodesulfobacteriota bacterium]|nr:hypothetical protein [Thermodesulfobacteriota bacterium]
MKIFHYHKTTGEYLGESAARIDPLESEKQGKNIYAIPAQAVTDQPPKPGKNKAARRLPDDSGWEIVPDFRGKKYWLADGTEIEIVDIGETVPKDALTEPPPTPPPTEDEINEQKIKDEMRLQAIASLKAKGDLPADFIG